MCRPGAGRDQSRCSQAASRLPGSCWITRSAQGKSFHCRSRGAEYRPGQDQRRSLAASRPRPARAVSIPGYLKPDGGQRLRAGLPRSERVRWSDSDRPRRAVKINHRAGRSGRTPADAHGRLPVCPLLPVLQVLQVLQARAAVRPGKARNDRHRRLLAGKPDKSNPIASVRKPARLCESSSEPIGHGTGAPRRSCVV